MKPRDIALYIALIGVGIAAIFGARNPEFMEERSLAQGVTIFVAAERAEAVEAFCETLGDELADRDERCNDEATGPLPPAELPEAATPHLQQMAALDTRIEEARAVLATDPPDPAQRLALWWGVAGWPFLFGLALAVGGGVASRRLGAADRAESAGKDESGEAVDFGVLLGETVERVRDLARRAEAGPDEAERDAIKKEIEVLQVGPVTRLVEARTQIELRYGLTGYASVIGPFSGGERRLNRAWCALVDGHLPECTDALRGSANEMEEAGRALAALVG